MSHAFADGVRSSALAGRLFGRRVDIAPVPTPRLRGIALPLRSLVAARAHRQLVRDTDAGWVPAQAPTRPALRTNSRPAGVRSVRTLIRRRDRLPGPTVTVGVLCAVSTALSAQLRSLGDDPSTLGVEVPMAKTTAREANNHYGNVGVGLYPELSLDERAIRIAADLADRRRRAQHPAMQAAGRAFAAVPAPLLRWGVAQFDPGVRSPVVIGNTVVSSVDRGAADLHFGGAPVVMTAGYPALSPMMGLAHGVHGIGDTIAVSVHAAESAVGDVDEYVARLDAALPG
jgi:WS/DGAT C-terminal domain